MWCNSFGEPILYVNSGWVSRRTLQYHPAHCAQIMKVWRGISPIYKCMMLTVQSCDGHLCSVYPLSIWLMYNSSNHFLEQSNSDQKLITSKCHLHWASGNFVIRLIRPIEMTVSNNLAWLSSGVILPALYHDCAADCTITVEPRFDSLSQVCRERIQHYYWTVPYHTQPVPAERKKPSKKEAEEGGTITVNIIRAARFHFGIPNWLAKRKFLGHNTSWFLSVCLFVCVYLCSCWWSKESVFTVKKTIHTRQSTTPLATTSFAEKCVSFTLLWENRNGRNKAHFSKAGPL